MILKVRFLCRLYRRTGGGVLLQNGTFMESKRKYKKTSRGIGSEGVETPSTIVPVSYSLLGFLKLSKSFLKFNL